MFSNESKDNFPVKISVIIAMKNAEKYILRTIDSIIVQSLPEIEIIVIDDNSDDSSVNIVKQYYDGIDNVFLYHNRGIGGPGICRNIGLSHARGEFIAFVDSDDFIATEFLETLYNMAVQDNADIAVCGYDKITSDAFLRSYAPDAGIYCGGNAFIEKLNTIEFVIWNKIYKHSFLKKNDISFRLPCYGEDWLFSFEAMFLAKKYTCTKKSLYYYYQHCDSVSHKPVEAGVFSSIYDFFIFLDEFTQKQKSLTEKMISQIETNFFFSSITCYIAPLYDKMSPHERLLLRDNIFSRQFGQGALHMKILLDAFFTLYSYTEQSLKYDRRPESHI
ncbi:glycosyltransferase [Pectinatus haikarae]|uniref:glycosyltransferase n=1 Tax=Pectinatus haikarae TaxID=349096 RepID=UPI0018C76EBF|nr:glycosyltransferase [Pectinatus haikarae]